MAGGPIGALRVGADRFVCVLCQHLRRTGLAGTQKREMVRRCDLDIGRVGQTLCQPVSLGADISSGKTVRIAEVDQCHARHRPVEGRRINRSAEPRVDDHGSRHARVAGIAFETGVIRKADTTETEEHTVCRFGTVCAILVLNLALKA